MNRYLIGILSFVSPKLVSNLAYKKLTNPQQRKLRQHEEPFLQKADQSQIRFGEFKIQMYTWGNPKDERILLIHGWEGQAGNFTDLIKKLIKENYYVIAFDGPSHGNSSKGETSLVEFSHLVGRLIEEFKCKKLVSHSFGGVATTYALFHNQHLEIEKYVLLTTPDKFSQRLDDVAAYLGINEKVKNIIIEQIEGEMEISVDQLSVSNFVPKIKVKKALIIHDKNDRVVPIAQSKNVHQKWADCEYIEVEGTGHFRILRTEEVIDTVVGFLN